MFGLALVKDRAAFVVLSDNEDDHQRDPPARAAGEFAQDHHKMIGSEPDHRPHPESRSASACRDVDCKGRAGKVT